MFHLVIGSTAYNEVVNHANKHYMAIVLRTPHPVLDVSIYFP